MNAITVQPTEHKTARKPVMLIMHTSLQACTLVEGPLAGVPIARILGHILGYNVAAVAGMSGLAA